MNNMTLKGCRLKAPVSTDDTGIRGWGIHILGSTGIRGVGIDIREVPLLGGTKVTGAY